MDSEVSGARRRERSLEPSASRPVPSLRGVERAHRSSAARFVRRLRLPPSGRRLKIGRGARVCSYGVVCVPLRLTANTPTSSSGNVHVSFCEKEERKKRDSSQKDFFSEHLPPPGSCESPRTSAVKKTHSLESKTFYASFMGDCRGTGAN